MRDIAEDVFDEELLRMPISPTSPVLVHDDRERQYREYWPAVRALLRRRYGGLATDHEELYQEAWTELLEYQASGKEVRDARALLKTIAERRARDRLRNFRPTVVDPGSLTFTEIADVGPSPDYETQVRLDAATIRQVIDTLDEREAAALKLRYDLMLDAKEVSRRLGITPKRLEKVMTSAYKQVAEALIAGSDGQSAWNRRQRSLLMACETGLASQRQRRKAEEMVANDPSCRAMLAELRVALRDVAAVLPLPVGLSDERGRRVLEVLTAQLDRVLPGGRRVAELAPHGAADSATATAGAAALGAGGVAKVALACLAAGGVAAACFPRSAPDAAPPPHRTAKVPPAAVPVVREPRSATLLATSMTASTKTRVRRRTKTRTVRTEPRRTETSVSATRYTAPPSPAPVGSVEFGPGTLGSSATPAQPAAAPTNGGGEFTP